MVAVFLLLVALLCVTGIDAGQVRHACRGIRHRPWMLRAVYVVPGVRVVVVGEHGETLDYWEVPGE